MAVVPTVVKYITPISFSPTRVVEERYEEVTASELPLDLQVSSGSIRYRMEPNGRVNITGFEGGTVTTFAVAGRPIELVSNDIILEGDDLIVS
jgi:hypothetical protein